MNAIASAIVVSFIGLSFLVWIRDNIGRLLGCSIKNFFKRDGSRQAAHISQNRELWTGKPCSRFRKCPCGEVFDMHGPDEVFVHVPHITAAERARSPLMSVDAKL
jgi:hypothetical protein